MKFSFIKAAAKHLSLVEIDSWSSNQHEFNGVSSLKELFGYNKQYFRTTFLFYDERGQSIQEYGELTWYDARENHPSRSEYRLYYTENSIVKRANVNDLLVVGKRNDNTIMVIIVKNKSPYYEIFMQLFGLSRITNNYVICDSIAV